MEDTEKHENIFLMRGLEMPAFEGASTDYRNAQRAAYTADADLLAINEMNLLQARSRHMSRNNSIASGVESKFVAKLGSVSVKWKKPDGTKHDLMQDLWDEFFENPSLDGKGDGKVMQATWNHDRFQSGEAISRMVMVTKNNPNRIKLKVQHIESEYLDIKYQGDFDTVNKNMVTRYGMTFENSRPKIYHFFRENYFGLQDYTKDNYQRVRVAADDVLHIFERLRSNQWRGIPVIAPMLSNLYELTDLREATVSKQKAAAAISWIVEQADQLSINALGSVKTAGKTTSEDEKRKLIFMANGGGVQYTNPGDKLHLVQSSDIGNNLIGLIKEELQTIAVGYGIPYYMLSGDTSGLSFASIRGILIEFRDKLEYIHHYINIPDGMEKLVKRFHAIARLSYPVQDAHHSYMFPRNYGVDELKDTQSDILEVQAGFATSESKREERHTTLEDVEQSRAIDKSLGITGLMDINAKQGESQTKGNSEATGQSSSN
jgi:lambda family phage portal protein